MLLNLSAVRAICANIDQVLETDIGLSIKGKIKEKNITIPCRVRLFERMTGRLVNETVTDNFGNYVFSHLTANKFFLVAHHPNNLYNAVIADMVVPK